jgi:hypothetical protein
MYITLFEEENFLQSFFIGFKWGIEVSDTELNSYVDKYLDAIHLNLIQKSMITVEFTVVDFLVQDQVAETNNIPKLCLSVTRSTGTCVGIWNYIYILLLMVSFVIIFLKKKKKLTIILLLF